MKKILIIDDSAFMRNILKDLLSNLGDSQELKNNVEVHEADGKENALKKLATLQPDLILVDIVMRESETEGVEFIEAIKDVFDTNKIIVVSSIGQVAILQRCMDMGVKQYLQKPFEKKQIFEAISSILK